MTEEQEKEVPSPEVVPTPGETSLEIVTSTVHQMGLRAVVYEVNNSAFRSEIQVNEFVSFVSNENRLVRAEVVSKETALLGVRLEDGSVKSVHINDVIVVHR